MDARLRRKQRLMHEDDSGSAGPMATGGGEQLTINIAVIENDPLRLAGLHAVFDPIPAFHLTAMSVPQIATNKGVGVVLVGNYSPVRCIEAMASLRSLRPDVPIIVTGAGANDEDILKALRHGAKGYVDETAPMACLVQAIHAVNAGTVWASRRVLSILIERLIDRLGQASQPGFLSLTGREKQVLQMLVEGRSNKEIACPLRIKERTVKAHIAKMMRKVGVRNRIALSVQAVSQSLLSSPR